MKLNYIVNIEDPHHHLVEITIRGQRSVGEDKLTFFLPSWSPGSYLMREYARNIRWFKAETQKGDQLFFEQAQKGQWVIDWSKSDSQSLDFEIKYLIYCHELTVRTSHVDNTHAFLHGPSVFMGIKDVEIIDPVLNIKFPESWSKISTGLKDISDKREEFIYSAPDYDTLIDCPIEIGNHDTDGFQVNGKNHHLSFYGKSFPHKQNIKQDIKTIVEYVSKTMVDMPYDDYTFMTHLIPGSYGGLEHLNSTALIFDGTRFNDRKSYIKWLELVAHEYFHTWNVKRIRPRELGPFDYTKENYTSMLWLAEGLTSFMDQLFVFRSGLMSLEEYLETQKENLNAFYSIPGRKFHSLEESSFNAWIKLYRPDENSLNSTISYYLKGGIVFFVLHVLLHEKGIDTNELLASLWAKYKERPELGVDSNEVYDIVLNLGGKDIANEFQSMIEDKTDPDIENYLKRCGISIEWDESQLVWLGIKHKVQGDNIVITNVVMDGPAFKDGLNAGDEIIAIDGVRVNKGNFAELTKNMTVERYDVLVTRCGVLQKLTILPAKIPRKIKALKCDDLNKVMKIFGSPF